MRGYAGLCRKTVMFEKDQRKDDVMAAQLTRFTAAESVVFVGRAQEKTPIFRTKKRRNLTTGRPYPWLNSLHGQPLLLLRGGS